VNQNQREQLLASLLDITIEQFRSRLAELADEQFENIPDEVNYLSGSYFQNMIEASEETDEVRQAGKIQLMFQAVAQMSDDTLHAVVKLFGKDPLE